jgi:hypothetical protein
MPKFTVELDYETVDDIIYKALSETQNNFKNSLGARNNTFFVNDQEADDIEIQKHIDALDLILDWYRVP